jgi:hypothetical protein
MGEFIHGQNGKHDESAPTKGLLDYLADQIGYGYLSDIKGAFL